VTLFQLDVDSGLVFVGDARVGPRRPSLDRQASPIDDYYESQLRGEAAAVADHHVHPIEPLAVRLTVAGPLP
jgi:hypothetical protein